MRPILVPGAHVLRRDADTLQVGLEPAERVLLPDVPRNRRLPLEPPGDGTRLLLDPLLVPDDAPLRASLPPSGGGDSDDLWARHSLASRARSRRRLELADRIVLVHPYGGPLGERLADEVRTLLRRSALPAPIRRRSGPRAAAAPREVREVRVYVGVGEPPRSLLEEPVASRIPHLLVRFVEGRAVVGPFVLPGGSACLGCVDLHRTETDPAWPLLLEQYSRLTRRDRCDGVPEPVDAAMAAVALGWAVRDVGALLDAGPPVTRSRTLSMTPDLVEVVLQEWPQRPDCACVVR